jgi:hypothetical protein
MQLIARRTAERDDRWSEAVAVGSLAFVEKVKEELLRRQPAACPQAGPVTFRTRFGHDPSDRDDGCFILVSSFLEISLLTNVLFQA